MMWWIPDHKLGWQSAIYRGKPRLSFGGYTSTSAIEITLFPTEDFGIVACATKPCHLPRAMSNVAADFLLEVNPGPWVPRMETAPFPFVSTEYEVVNDPTDHLKPTPPPRSPHYYVGTYTSPIAPNVAFKITQTNGYLVIRFLNGHSESLQPTSQLFHLDNGIVTLQVSSYPNRLILTGTFYISTKTFFPPHLSYAAMQTKTVESNLKQDQMDKKNSRLLYPSHDLTNGLKFHKSVPYVATTTTAPVQPPTTAKILQQDQRQAHHPQPCHRVEHQTIPDKPRMLHYRQLQVIPLHQLHPSPPRSRQSSNATPAAVSTAPPTIPTRKTSTGADANSPMCTNATLDKLLSVVINLSLKKRRTMNLTGVWTM
ncbi:hypothetical protein BCR33DRAFT_807654 [Rhizoclosmatium globosum]|uniref:Uncharacterized protein n=1 Tax=Rhizoclosmatium globosum TaxID=329046 RepID=A0A1Y2CJZ2_9FUNG|nr:hypothetical protein BCR33DRAFT_807654 [Rhizoclosmatium globosum]|eukprot:ORY47338.1 hypothetical protein BCR33DRAFT_807654 [Rhizoclosmatium globosum]